MTSRTELLARPKTDPIDRCPYRRPEFVLPDTYLPRWNRQPLCRKIPAKTNPEDQVIFTRPRLGKNLYRTFPKKDFDLSPRKDLPLDYNCLHDPYLHTYFRVNARNYMGLVKDGYITPLRDYVCCTQAEFNHYREYIRDIMAQAEKERRKAEEKRIDTEYYLRTQERIQKEKNKPLVWLKKQLLKKRKHQIQLLRGLEPAEDNTDEEEEYDEYRAKAQEKKEFLKDEDEVKRELDQIEVIKELRYALRYEKIERKEAKKRQKEIDRWYEMDDCERDMMYYLDDLKRDYDKDYYQRVADRQRRHQKMWAKYRGLELEPKKSSIKPGPEEASAGTSNPDYEYEAAQNVPDADMQNVPDADDESFETY